MKSIQEVGKLTYGKTGNVSFRVADGFMITPTGSVLTDVTDMVLMPGGENPSTDWRLHQEIYDHYPEIGAVVHLHSPYATALACKGWKWTTLLGLPFDFHEMMGDPEGGISCTEYALHGTYNLRDSVFLCLPILKDKKACLMERHGQVAVGKDLEEACYNAGLVEEMAKIYILSKIL